MIYPKNIEAVIDFTQVRTQLLQKCRSIQGQEHTQALSFLTNFHSLNTALDQTTEMLTILQTELNFSLSEFDDIRPLLTRTNPDGTAFYPEDMPKLQHTLNTLQELHNFFKQKPSDLYPELHTIAEDLIDFTPVLKAIQKLLDEEGNIRDNASPELAQIRSSIRKREAELSRTIQSIIQHAQKQGYLDPTSSATIRDGKLTIPIISTYKRKISGIILGESATGKTSFIHPIECIQLENEIAELQANAKREIARILQDFTQRLRPFYPELTDALIALGLIDFIHAKAQLALQMQAHKPALTPHPRLNWINARHPLLEQRLKASNQPLIPLTIQLSNRKRILLISGPNAGGKSVCLKTVALLQYMLQCGLLIPASPNSEAGLFNHLCIDIGDQQSIENDLSTYSAHLKNMKHFTILADHKTLILIDEFGSGTEPAIGGAIAEAILHHFCKQNAYGVITTHYGNLKDYALNNDGIQNAAMLYNPEKLQPLFKLQIGAPGSSFAFEIAQNIGLPKHILQSAQKRIQPQINYEKQLQAIESERLKIETKQQNIAQLEQQLQVAVQRRLTALETTAAQQKQILQEAKLKADQILQESNKLIENTIRTIKQADAEKTATQQARQKLQSDINTLTQTTNSEKEIQQRIAKLKSKGNKPKKDNKQQTEPTPPQQPEKPLQIGDRVLLIARNTAAEILSINNNILEIAIGSLRMRVKASEVRHLSRDEYRKATITTTSSSLIHDIGQRRLDYVPRIDVRGMRTDEALTKVEAFVDEGKMLGYNSLRILHGKGDGILRKMIQQYLNQTPGLSYQDEDIREGGTGITIVTLH